MFKTIILQITETSLSEPILFTDDTSVTISTKNFEVFHSMARLVLSRMITWFCAYKLVPNLDKTKIMKFVKINLPCSALHICYKENYIENTTNIRFLGLQIDNHLNWENHIELMIPK